MAKGESDSGNGKKKLEAWLAPLGLIGTFLGLIVGLVENITKFLKVTEQHFYLAITLLWAAVILITLRLQVPRSLRNDISKKAFRFLLILLASIFYLISLFSTIYEYHFRKTGPSEVPEIKINMNPFIGLAHAQPKPEIRFRIESFYLNDQLCSFVETSQTLMAAGGPKYRTFSFDFPVFTAFRQGKCTGPTGNRPIRNVLSLLHSRLQKMNQQDLIRYIRTPDDLSRVTATRADIFERILFTNAELREMRKTSPADFETVKEWLLNCVGIYQPVLTLVVRNLSHEPLMLTHVVYDVVDVGSIKGGETGPIYPEVTYDHTLRHEKGEQRFSLNPPMQIKPADLYSFNLRLFSEKKGDGLVWLLKIKILNSQGQGVSTEPVQIIMSKKG